MIYNLKVIQINTNKSVTDTHHIRHIVKQTIDIVNSKFYMQNGFKYAFLPSFFGTRRNVDNF